MTEESEPTPAAAATEAPDLGDAPEATSPASSVEAGPMPAAAASPVVPSARALLGDSLELASRTSRSLRGASFWIAVQMLLLVGPLAVMLVVVLTSGLGDVIGAFSSPFPTARGRALVGPLSGASFLALIALVVLAVESRIVAAAILGGAASGRPLALREAIRRSRQTFWRVVRATFIVEIPLNIVSQIVGGFARGPVGETEATLLVTTIATTLLGAPFAYIVAGIVLGDVGAVEAIRRSIRLARVRWRLAILVSVFATVAQYLLIFGFFAGADVLVRAGEGLGLSVEGGPNPLVVVLVLLAVAAVGSLLFTVAALAVAPQVVAFLGLTHYGAGLDRARNDTEGQGTVRWLSWGVVVGVLVSLALAWAGISAATG